MNIPNILTAIRVLLLPLLLLLYLLNPDPTALNAWTWGFVGTFVLASFTDFLDGFIARRYDMVTTMGKFLDPIADKLLVLLALLILQEMTLVPLWTVFLIIAREFMVTGIRLLAVQKGIVIAAGQLGKAKTAVTLVAITLIFVTLVDIGTLLYYIGVALTVISGIEYFVKNRQIFA